MAFLEFEPLHRKMFQHIAVVVYTLTWHYHFTDIITSTAVIFLREMKPHSGSFLPLCHDSFWLQVSISVDWHHCFAMRSCHKNMQTSIKGIDNLGDDGSDRSESLEPNPVETGSWHKNFSQRVAIKAWYESSNEKSLCVIHILLYISPWHREWVIWEIRTVLPETTQLSSCYTVSLILSDIYLNASNIAHHAINRYTVGDIQIHSDNSLPL